MSEFRNLNGEPDDDAVKKPEIKEIAPIEADIRMYGEDGGEKDIHVMKFGEEQNIDEMGFVEELDIDETDFGGELDIEDTDDDAGQDFEDMEIGTLRRFEPRVTVIERPAYGSYEEYERSEAMKSNKPKRGMFKSVMLACLALFIPLGIGIGLAIGVQVSENVIIPRIIGEENRFALYLYDENGAARDIMGLNATDAQGNALPFMFSYADLVEVIKPSVVTISTQTTMTRWQFGRNQSYTVVGAGTGFIFDATDTMYYIATNAHVIDGATGVTVSIDGSQPLNAIPIGKDIANDLAVIAVPRVAAQRAGIHSVSVAKLGDSDKMRVGDIVLAVGNSLGEGIVVTDGIISALNRRITLESNITLNVLQTNAAINQGNSGGPLVNLIGEVIGVNTAKASQNVTDGTRASIEGTGYAIPSNIVKDVIVRIMNGEMSESIATATPRLGISGGTLSDELMEKLAEELGIEIRGVYVSGVTEGESADLAGVLPDDIITAINGRQIADFEGLRDIILQNKPGDTVTLIIWRNGTMLTLNAVLGSSF